MAGAKPALTTSKSSSDKPKRGGRRENAGRPTLDGDLEIGRHTVTLSAKVADKAKLLGAGNLSAGLRVAVNTVLPDDPPETEPEP